jgi:hypothetical protein
MPIARFIDLSEVPNEKVVIADEIAQRPLDKSHAASLAIYILKGLVHAARNLRANDAKSTTHHDEILSRMGAQSYFALQPIVVNIPCKLDNLQAQKQFNGVGDELTVRIAIPPTISMWVIDGQHRRWAMNLVLEFLRYVRAQQQYPKKGSLYRFNGDPQVSIGYAEVWREAMTLALTHCTVAIEAHIDLSVEQQRQLFHDLNNLGKSVSPGMAFDFDNSNAVNIFIKETLIDEGRLKAPVVEKDVTDWASHDGSMTRKDLVAINSILFLNKTNPKTATPPQVEKMEDVARRFWEEVSGIPGFGKPKAKLKTVAAQPVVLKALAKLTYDFSVGRSENSKYLDILLDGISDVDFSHENPMWRYYELNPAERARMTPGLEAYLPPKEEGNRDVGGTDETGKMRFGAKHNDIYPIIGDMIRWRLKLPTRHALDTVKAA